MSEAARQALRAYESESWRRWEMDEVATPQDDNAVQVEESFQLPQHLLEELEQLRQQARDEGYAQGYQHGQQQGLAQGLESGHAQGLEAGRAEGYEAGKKQAIDEGTSLNQAQVQRLTSVLDTSTQALHDLEAETGQALIHLAVSIAQQVVRSTLSVEPEKILDTVRDILQMDAAGEGLLRVRLHPEDLELIQPHLRDDPSAQRWRLQSDSTIERGGCIVETALGNIDATLQTRWQRVVSALGHHQPWVPAP